MLPAIAVFSIRIRYGYLKWPTFVCFFLFPLPLCASFLFNLICFSPFLSVLVLVLPPFLALLNYFVECQKWFESIDSTDHIYSIHLYIYIWSRRPFDCVPVVSNQKIIEKEQKEVRYSEIESINPPLNKSHCETAITYKRRIYDKIGSVRLSFFAPWKFTERTQKTSKNYQANVFFCCFLFLGKKK